jgi:hypothetical protein
MTYLQLNQFQELYLNGAFSEVVVTANHTPVGVVYNIAFIYVTSTCSDYSEVGYLISQKNVIRPLKSLDSCFSLLHFVDTFKVEDQLYFGSRSGI